MAANGKKPGGRRRTETRIDLEKLKDLAYHGCTQREMADYFGVHKNTMEHICNREPVMSMIAEMRGKRHDDIRDKQLEVALSGNPTMLIWLGKQELGQTDATRHEVAGVVGRPIEVKHDGADLGAEQLAALIEGLAGLGAFAIPGRAEATREARDATKH